MGTPAIEFCNKLLLCWWQFCKTCVGNISGHSAIKCFGHCSRHIGDGVRVASVGDGVLNCRFIIMAFQKRYHGHRYGILAGGAPGTGFAKFGNRLIQQSVPKFPAQEGFDFLFALPLSRKKNRSSDAHGAPFPSG